MTGAYPGMFNSTNAPGGDGVTSDGHTFFGQAYYGLSDTLKLTVGVRYNRDDKFVADTSPFLDANYICGLVEQLTSACPLENPGEYSREARFVNAVDNDTRGPDDYNAARAELYGVTDLFQAAVGTAPRSAERLAAARAIPIVPQPGERRALTGSPDTFPWEETTYRIGLDWQFAADSMLYGFFTTGYKPGGFNPPVSEALQGNAAYSYLQAEVTDGFSVDPTNRTASDPDWIKLENWVPGATAGINYVAEAADLTPQVIRGLIGAGAALPLPGTVYENGIPTYIDHAATAAFGVSISDGLEQDLNGNTLPNSPEHTLNIGAAYGWDVGVLRGRIIARVDWYWQSEMHAREFNTAGDEIKARDQWNASLIYESSDGHWSAHAWIRNIEGDDNITGHYLTSDTSGFFRNYFLTEPRIFGASFRYSTGG